MTIRISKEVIRKIPAATLPEITLIRPAPAAIEFVAEANKIVAYVGNRTIVWHVPLTLPEELPKQSPKLPKREICHCPNCSSRVLTVTQNILPRRNSL